MCAENVALDKLVYEWADDNDDDANTTTTTYNFCNDSVTNTSSTEDSWWTIDLATDYRISYIEISPHPDSLCPENSLCGQFNPLTLTVAMGTAIKQHLVSDQVEPSFVIFDIRAL